MSEAVVAIVARLLEFLNYWRNAAKMVLGVSLAPIVLIKLAPSLSEWSNALAVPVYFLQIILAIASYSVGVLAVEGFLRAAEAATKAYKKRCEARNSVVQRAAEHAAIAERLRTLLPDLPRDQITILRMFDGRAVELKPLSSPVCALLGSRAIYQIQAIDLTRALFALHPAAELVVRQFFADERARSLSDSLKGLTVEEREFLALFCEPNPSSPLAVAHPLLTEAVYRAVGSLAAKDILLWQRAVGPPYTEKVELRDDAVPLLESQVLKAPIRRRRITLSLANIKASGMSGSGTPPGNR